MNCVLCGKNSEHVCLQCCINYAVQAGASRRRIKTLLRRELVQSLKEGAQSKEVIDCGKQARH